MTSDDLWPWYLTFDLINIQRNPYCIFDASLVPIRHLTWPQMILDLGAWPLTSLTYKGTFIASLTKVWFQSYFQLFKGDSNNKNQNFPPNLVSDDLWPWYVTFDLINIWRNPYYLWPTHLLVNIGKWGPWLFTPLCIAKSYLTEDAHTRN